MKIKLMQLMDYVIGKAIDMVLVKVQAGALDAIIQSKVDSIIDEVTAV